MQSELVKKGLIDKLVFHKFSDNENELSVVLTDPEVVLLREVLGVHVDNDSLIKTTLFNKKCKYCGQEFGTFDNKYDTCLDCQKRIDFENDQKESDIYTKKKDKGKLPWCLMPWEQLEKVVKVLQMGMQKYGPNSWQTVPADNNGFSASERYESALYRHMTEWSKGNRIDEESGESHLAHVICNALFMLYFEEKR